MGHESLLIVAAASLAVLLLPSPAGKLLRDYTLSRGKARSLLLLPSLWFGYLAAGVLAGAAYLILHSVMPAMTGALSWLAVVFIVIFALRAQRQHLGFRIADNDNLPEHGLLRMAMRLVVSAPRPTLIVALLSVLYQATDAPLPPVQTVAFTGLSYAVAALIAPLIQVFTAERSARKIRLFRQRNPASHKAPTRFIASRAVTAGYRRIAA